MRVWIDAEGFRNCDLSDEMNATPTSHEKALEASLQRNIAEYILASKTPVAWKEAVGYTDAFWIWTYSLKKLYLLKNTGFSSPSNFALLLPSPLSSIPY